MPRQLTTQLAFHSFWKSPTQHEKAPSLSLTHSLSHTPSHTQSPFTYSTPKASLSFSLIWKPPTPHEYALVAWPSSVLMYVSSLILARAASKSDRPQVNSDSGQVFASWKHMEFLESSFGMNHDMPCSTTLCLIWSEVGWLTVQGHRVVLIQNFSQRNSGLCAGNNLIFYRSQRLNSLQRHYNRGYGI